MRGRFLIVRLGLTSFLTLGVSALLSHASTNPELHFNERVKPLLDSRCISCHGPDKVKGGLRMDSREALLKGGDGGPAVVPGKPDDSLIVQAVMHSKKDLEMPPKEKLTTNDIAVLRRWIAEGAIWTTNNTQSSQGDVAATRKPGERTGDAWTDPRNPIVRIFGGQRLDLWSLKPVRAVQPPARQASAKAASAVRNPIDSFVAAKLRDHGLHPQPEADTRTLVRRLYLSLTGLPPSPDVVQAFINDKSPGAYERQVDDLLASPRYGEHWARIWMDVIRYSDSNGFDWDEFRPRAWRFRDYLIRSFNSDKPFDQLVREHLAGDELIEGAPTNAAEQDHLIATGYLRLGPQDNSAPLFNEQSRARAEYMADLTETTASAFLGLTMSCCRCHDHKYDPLSQADHFRLRAFFEPVKYGDDIPLDLAPEQEAIKAHNKNIDELIAPVKKQQDMLVATVKNRVREEKLSKLTPEERTLLNTPKEQRTNDLKAKVEAAEKKVEVKDKEAIAASTDEEKKEHKKLGEEIDALTKKKRSFTFGLLATDKPDNIPVTRIHAQGDHKAEREAVSPGFISILDPNPAKLAKPLNPKTTGRRLTLAKWIASPENPLTARVFVNRVWQAHFGQGLVATPNDFGLAGAAPTHPELLDWLAREFTQNGWGIKRLHRLIVTSATYRQASAGDQQSALSSDRNNTLLWRQNLRRLSSEQLRDSLLSVSGILKIDHTGGAPIWPDLPQEILQANPAFLDDNAEKTKGWYPSPKTNRNVRSVYLIQKRTVRLPFMETFDMPENSASCPRRTESIVAPQALSLLNGEVAVESAKALALRVEARSSSADRDTQIEQAFLLALQRAPDAGERKSCSEFLQTRSLTELCRALLNLNEFIYAD